MNTSADVVLSYDKKPPLKYVGTYDKERAFDIELIHLNVSLFLSVILSIVNGMFYHS